MGEKEKQPFQLSFNSSLRVAFQGARVTSDGGFDSGARVGRASGPERARATALERFPPGQEYPVASDRLAEAVGVQPIGRV